jgi:hypothetical protein
VARSAPTLALVLAAFSTPSCSLPSTQTADGQDATIAEPDPQDEWSDLPRSPIVGAADARGVEDAGRTIDWRERKLILYVTIDRVGDASVHQHVENMRGLEAIVAKFDPSLTVHSVSIKELINYDARSLDERYKPFAIFGAGSFTEWYQYGLDPSWRAQVNNWIEIVRTTRVPMFAVCGSHELVAIAFRGFGAVAHMSDHGPPISISEELRLSHPHALWPSPRVGEEGVYPIRATSAGMHDPVSRDALAPFVVVHHRDMVIDSTGFTLLYSADPHRTPHSVHGVQPLNRCQNQAMRLDSSTRLLYSLQFHPELPVPGDLDSLNDGFGSHVLNRFLHEADRFWRQQ